MRRAPHKLLQPKIKVGQSVKVIGLGGVGGVVARYLAVFLADKQSRLVLIDGDSFEPKNATRMMFSGYGNKANVTAAELLPHVRNTQLCVMAIEEYVTAENISRLIHEDDIVIMAVDNHTTRKMVNAHCAKLKDVVLISGGNDGMEEKDGRVRRGSYGNVQVFIRKDDKDASPSLTRYHPEIENPTDHHPDDASCAELMMSVPQILFTNMQVATSILGTLWLHLSNELHYSEVAFDLADAVMNPVPIPAPTTTQTHE